MRVPLLAMGGPSASGATVDNIVAGIDLAPTILEIAKAEPLNGISGKSFAKQLTSGENSSEWRDDFLYEYYWEYNYPYTPSTFAVRSDRYKLIQYHGVWDTEELYDLENDPYEMTNLINDSNYKDTRVRLRSNLYKHLSEDNIRKPSISFTERFGSGAVFRSQSGPEASEFPERWLRNPNDPDVWQHLRYEGGKPAEKN
jgi:arylsulfatase A-like enzyme